MLKGNSDKKMGSHGVIDTAESNLGDFQIDFLGLYTAMRNGFSPWIRAQGGLFDEKKPRVENLVTLSLLKQWEMFFSQIQH
jgi:hypothetical protein